MSDKGGSIFQRGHVALWEASGKGTTSSRTYSGAQEYLGEMIRVQLPAAVIRRALNVNEIRVLVVENYEVDRRYRAQLLIVDVEEVAAFTTAPLSELRDLLSLPVHRWALVAVYRELDRDGAEGRVVVKVFKGSFESTTDRLRGTSG